MVACVGVVDQSVRSSSWFSVLLDTLRTFRRRALARVTYEALTAASAGFVIAVVVAIGLIVAGAPVSAARVAVVVAVVLALAASAGLVLRARRRFRTDDDVARHLEACDPELRTDLRTALDYGRRAGGEDPDTAGLRALLVARVTAALHARTEALAAWVPRRDLRPFTTAAATLALGLGVANALAPEPVGGAIRALAFGSAPDAPVPSIEPIVTAVDLTVRPPAYTDRLAERLRFTTGDIRALAGSEVQLRASTARPIESATVVVETGDATERYAASLADPYILQATFPIGADGTYRFEVVLADGARRTDPMTRRIRILPDRVPDIQLTHPTEDLEVTPDQIVDVAFVATDDFALVGVQLVWAFAGDEAATRTVPLTSNAGARTFEHHIPFDLRPLLLVPRDEVLLWVEATDNNAIAGPQTGRSAVVRLRVASPEDRSDAILAAKEQVFESLLAQLGRSLSASLLTPRVNEARAVVLEPVDAADGERNARIVSARVAHAAWADVLAGWEELLNAMETEPSTPEADFALLEASYRQTYAAVRDQAAVLDGLGGGLPADGLSRARFDVVARAHAPTVERNERAVLIFEDLIALQKADDVKRALDELEGIRERLTELLEAYRDTQDPALREQIERELRRLEQRMRELLQRIASQVDRLPTEHLNAEAIDPSEVSENLQEMGGALDRVRERLNNGDIEGAIAAMAELDTTLDALQGELGDPLDGASPDSASVFDQDMAALMDQVNDLEAQEAALLEDTEALQNEMRARHDEKVADDRNEALQRLEAQAEALREAFESLPEDRLSDALQADLQAATEGLRDLEGALERQDVIAAEAAADRLSSQISEVIGQLWQDELLLRRSESGLRQLAEARDVAMQGRREAGEIRSELLALMEGAEPQPSPGDRAQMRALSERQQQVQSQLDALGEQMRAVAERNPTVVEQLGEPVEQVGQRMGEAREALRDGQPRPSIQGQQSALEGLQALRQQMQQMTQEQRERERRDGQGRRPNDRVVVPEDGTSDRRDYRDRVVDAMREGGLQAYDAEIQEYYEALLR